MTEFAELIRGKRKVMGLSQFQVAKLSKMSRGYLSDLETGKTLTDSLDILARLAQTLELPLEEIVAAAGYECCNDEAAHRQPLPPEVEYIATVISGFSLDYQELLKRAVRELAAAWEQLQPPTDEGKEKVFRHDEKHNSRLL